MGKEITQRLTHKSCLVLGGGEIRDYGAVAALLDSGCFVICADSGYRHCAGLGVDPDLLVGDFDSIDECPDVPKISLSPEKDITDSDFAVREALRRGYGNILMAGMTGGRPDHTFANLQLLAWLSGKGVNAFITDGVTYYYGLAASEKGGELRLPPKKGCYFSVFAMDICSNVNIRGAKYPLVEYPLRFDEPRAVSNEFLDGEAVITLGKGTIIVIVTPML